MKTKIYVLLMLLIPMLSMQAGTAFYVDPTSPNANDQNDGTSAALPWRSLNATKWTNGCVVNLSTGTHALLASAVIKTNVTLQGASKNDVVIEGLSDDDIARGITSPQFFHVAGSNMLTIKNITIRNFVAAVGSSIFGGMFNVEQDATLNLENVDVKNALLPANPGAAIYSVGTINCTNVLFENCRSSQGGAISIVGIGIAKFENVTFRNNSTIDGTHSWKNGGAIKVGSRTADISINNCFFDSNISNDDSTNPYLVTPVGGAIYYKIYAGGDEKLKITNSTFNNNFAATSGGAICFDAYGAESAALNINFLFTNNTFIGNNCGKDEGKAILFAPSCPKLIGSMSFVNNTFFQNGPTNPTVDKSCLWLYDFAIDLCLINNIICDKTLNTVDNKSYGSGLVIQQSATTNYVSLKLKGNVLDAYSGNMSADTRAQIKSTDNKIVSKDVINLNTVLTIPATGAPYLKINNISSVAVDFGINTWLLGTDNLVPTLDIRGTAMIGTNKDAGAYEFSNSTLIESLVGNDKLLAYPNPFKDVINLSEEAISISIIDVSGATLITKSNVSTLNTSNLNKGIYLLRIINNDGKASTLKMLK